ncbi:response regulator transcription factor [Rhodospirillum centenum]|uniref:DNA-binding response regulator, putative n=1 Tax=Rhodospirillum centenum (strain ATCC 51521 / SW) TaxID=414684 RepID=B6IVH1_RHOCS|nr:response regulator transcription factor [Rhodospirillum centenum]ACJ00295.1 DNA-binding response regulator, putative [Rhodospirillum centenum SW]
MQKTGTLILLADDDAALRQTLTEQLRLDPETEVREADSAAAALAAARAERFDAVLLDSGLPDLDGRALCRALRAEGLDCPVILMTAPADTGDDPADCGATESIAKPFRLGVLLARLRALLRRAAETDAAGLPIGPYRFLPTAKMLLEDGRQRRIRLTEKECQILAYLHRADGRTIDRDTLLGEVWGYNEGVTTHTLETHVYRLRRKIERDPARAEILVTEPGGYRLVP